MPFTVSFRAMPYQPGFDDFQPILPRRAVRRDMPVDRLPVIFNSLQKSATFVSFCPMAATARRSFAAVIFDPLYVVRLLEVCLLFALACSFAVALDNNRTIAQFAHTAWGPKDGAPTVVTALAQTSDGYLWLGSSDGLYRFDGVVFERYQPQSGRPFPAQEVRSLLALPNSDLWIGFRSGGISFLRNGHATNYTVREGVPVGMVRGLAQDREGTIWAATTSGLARLEGDRWKEVGKDWNFPGKSAIAVFLDGHGTLWVSTEDTLVFLPPGARRFQPTGTRESPVYQIAQAAGGKLWMAETTRSVRPIPLSDKRQPPDETEIQVGSVGILFDADGALWITSIGDGLRRSPAPELLKGKIKEFSNAVESFTAKDGLSDDFIRAILQDREGNIWVGTANGLDRFRKTNLAPVVFPSKLDQLVWVAGDGGDIWIENGASLIRVHGGRADRANPIPCLTVSAYRDSAGAIWWVCGDAIYRYHDGNYTRIALPPSFPKTYKESGIQATEDGSGALWLSAEREGLFYRREGDWHRLESASEFAKLSPRAAFTDWMGRAWFGYGEGTMILLKDENIQRVFLPTDSPVGSVKAINGRGRHIWVGGDSGLAFFDGNRFLRIVPADAETFGSVMGVMETSDGSLWLAESRGVIQVPTSEVQQALKNPSYRVKYRVFDSFDGLPGTFAGINTNQREIQGTDGTLWFAASGGVVWVDPANISTNVLPPPVLIRSVKANGRQSGSQANLVLPPRTTDLQIGYTALSLAVPEKVRFRYRLEGVDKDWQDAGTRREAFYTRLGPGEYHFRVLACNNDGVWNNAGAALDFRIAPAWFQTIWFQTFCGCVFLFLLWSLYQLRVKQLQRQFAIGLEARVDERTRIARDLHDTLLQSFQGAVFQFQAARRLLLRNADNAMQVVDEAIQAAEEGITEGRAAIHDLRPETAAQRDLPKLLNATGRELADTHQWNGEAPTFGVIVEGGQRDLPPILQNEVYRISREVIRNAFAHAVASHIEVEIRYDQDQLRVRIRDDGKGIDPKILEDGGQPGHWGISGMRERAQRIGAQLAFWSEVGAGTEVQLIVPGAIAYKKHRDGH
jgi:signal transduction histidine kinase/ligand-binding sensor domain-containing protein